MTEKIIGTKPSLRKKKQGRTQNKVIRNQLKSNDKREEKLKYELHGNKNMAIK